MKETFEQDLLGCETIAGDTDHLINIIFGLPINWVGNKKRMLRRFLDFLNHNHIEFGSFLDVFSGSGVIPMLLAGHGKKVVVNDLLTLSTTWLLNSLTGSPVKLEDHEIQKLMDISKPLNKRLVFLGELYDGCLLNQSELDFLEAYKQNVINLFGPYMAVGFRLKSVKPEKPVKAQAFIGLEDGKLVFGNVVGEPYKAAFAMQMLCVHILQQAFMGGRCYKSQLLAVAEKRLSSGIVSSKGNSNAIGFKEHLFGLLRPKTCPLRELTEYFGTQIGQVTVFNSDAEELLSSGIVKADIAYFDPPYGGYNSDYAWMYRVCEELLTGTKLELNESLREASVKFKGNDYERDKNFDKKQRKNYQDNFKNLLSVSEAYPIWIISFNESSFSSIDDIVGLVEGFRQDVVVETVDGYKYNYRENGAKMGSEYLILARTARTSNV